MIAQEDILAKVILHFSMSLDGFVAGPEVGVDHPMGKGGERLHDWMFPANPDLGENSRVTSPRGVDGEIVDELIAAAGAVVLGNRTFDVGLRFWNDTPFPAPSFVLTHEPHEPLAMKSGVFTFVTDGIESAIAQAKKAAGKKHVVVMGACVAQQALVAGLADEIRLQLIPVLLGGGERLFDNIGPDHIELVRTRAVPTAAVTHLDFRVLR
jgi:dihydrofolate reductase